MIGGDSKRLFRALLRFNSTYLVIGGISAGILGEPRFTADVDILLFIELTDLPVFLSGMRKAGAVLAIREQVELARKYGALRFRMGQTWVDCLIGDSVFDFEAVSRRRLVSWQGVKIPIPTPEDLILMKLVVGRGKDWSDAMAIAGRCGKKLDAAYMKRHAIRFIPHKGPKSVAYRLALLLRRLRKGN